MWPALLRSTLSMLLAVSQTAIALRRCMCLHHCDTFSIRKVPSFLSMLRGDMRAQSQPLRCYVAYLSPATQCPR